MNVFVKMVKFLARNGYVCIFGKIVNFADQNQVIMFNQNGCPTNEKPCIVPVFMKMNIVRFKFHPNYL